MAVWNIRNRSLLRSNCDIMAEHYQQERIMSESYLQSISSNKIKDYFREVITLISPKKMNESWNIYDLSDSISNFLSASSHYIKSSSTKKIAQKDDFIISRLRYYLQEMAIVPESQYNIGLSTEYLVYRKTSDLSQLILLPFALSSYVQKILKWAQTGNEHPRFASDTFSNIYLPDILIENADTIVELINKSIELRNSSESLYQQAVDMLNEELQLDKLQLSHDKCYTAKYSDVIHSHRMNAEFFSPTIAIILSQSFFNNSQTICELFTIVRGYTPKVYFIEGTPVIKTKNVRTPQIDKKRIADFASDKEPLVLTEENDLLLAAMGVGSLGRMSYISKDDVNCNIDGTIRILRKKNTTAMNVEIPAMLFLSTDVGQKLIYRGIVGSTGIISLPDEYIKTIPIPKFSEHLCKTTTKLVLKSIESKKQSEQLLSQAKQRVEELIEQEAN